MRHGTLPALRNDAIRRAIICSQCYAFAEIAFFRLAVDAGQTFKAADFDAAQVARKDAWLRFLALEEACSDLANAGMGQEGLRQLAKAGDRIRRGRLAYLQIRSLPACLADQIPNGVRPARTPEGGQGA